MGTALVKRYGWAKPLPCMSGDGQLTFRQVAMQSLHMTATRITTVSLALRFPAANQLDSSNLVEDLLLGVAADSISAVSSS
jgi:hypothetical protein